MHFSCDRIYKLGGALKVFIKSIKLVLNELHFIVNLYSFPLPHSRPGKPFLTPGKLFSPSQTNLFLKLTPLPDT